MATRAPSLHSRGRLRAARLPRFVAVPVPGLVQVFLAAALAAHAMAASAQAPAPARATPQAADAALARVNLAVEWRWGEAAPRRPGGAGASGAGAVVTSTAGSMAPPQGQVTVRSGAGASASAPALPVLPARVVVANGGGARVRLAEAVPLQSVQAWQEPAGTGAALIPGWSESVQAFELRVRWPGGRAVADVELEIEQVQPASADGSVSVARRERLATRAWVPLDEWVTVAVWGEAAAGATARAVEAGTVSTAGLGARAARVLQLRLSALQLP
jgi:hypothetical protein